MTTKADLEAMFLNSEKFYKEIDDIVWKNDVSYIEAVMIVCDAKAIDPEDLVKLKLISPILRLKLQDEAIINGQIKAQPTLC